MAIDSYIISYLCWPNSNLLWWLTMLATSQLLANSTTSSIDLYIYLYLYLSIHYNDLRIWMNAKSQMISGRISFLVHFWLTISFFDVCLNKQTNKKQLCHTTHSGKKEKRNLFFSFCSYVCSAEAQHGGRSPGSLRWEDCSCEHWRLRYSLVTPLWHPAWKLQLCCSGQTDQQQEVSVCLGSLFFFSY